MGLDGQAFAAFGATGIDHGAASAGFHADQKAMGARTARFGGLVSAFHLYLCLKWGNRRLSLFFKPLSGYQLVISNLLSPFSSADLRFFNSVDKFLIKYAKCAFKSNLSTV